MQHRNSMRRGRSEDGISEVVGFVIILAVLVAGLSLYLTYAAPRARQRGRDQGDGRCAGLVRGLQDRDGPALAEQPAHARRQQSIDEGPALFNATIGQVTLRRVINAGTVREKGFVERYFPLLAPIPSSAEVSVRDGETLEIRGIRSGEAPYHQVHQRHGARDTPRTTTTGSSSSTTTSSAASSSGSGTEGGSGCREREHGGGAAALDLQRPGLRRRSSSSP